MSRIRWAVLGVAVALLTGPSSTLPVAGREVPSLEGSWEVTAVQRAGESDPHQVGAQLTFAGNNVKFQPKVEQFVDGTS